MSIGLGPQPETKQRKAADQVKLREEKCCQKMARQQKIGLATGSQRELEGQPASGSGSSRCPVASRISDALMRSGYPDLRRAGFDFSAGTVTLHGTVGSYYMKQMAQEILRQLESVDCVRNHLSVTQQYVKPR